MEVILKEDVESLGGAGKVVKVRDGFARNFLLPRGIAVPADSANLKELEHHKRAIQARLAKQKAQAASLAEKIAGLAVTIARDAGEEDKLFGSVTAQDIVTLLSKEKIAIEKRQVRLEAPLKKLGTYEIPIKLHPEVNATLKVAIVKA